MLFIVEDLWNNAFHSIIIRLDKHIELWCFSLRESTSFVFTFVNIYWTVLIYLITSEELEHVLLNYISLFKLKQSFLMLQDLKLAHDSIQSKINPCSVKIWAILEDECFCQNFKIPQITKEIWKVLFGTKSYLRSI